MDLIGDELGREDLVPERKRHESLSASALSLEASIRSSGVESLMTSVSDLFQSSQMFKIEEETTIDKEVKRLAAKVASSDGDGEDNSYEKRHRVAEMIQEAFQQSRSSDIQKSLINTPLSGRNKATIDSAALVSPLTVDTGINSTTSMSPMSPWTPPDQAVSFVFSDDLLPLAPFGSSPGRTKKRIPIDVDNSSDCSPTAAATRTSSCNTTLSRDLPPKLPRRKVTAPPRIPSRSPSGLQDA